MQIKRVFTIRPPPNWGHSALGAQKHSIALYIPWLPFYATHHLGDKRAHPSLPFSFSSPDYWKGVTPAFFSSSGGICTYSSDHGSLKAFTLTKPGRIQIAQFLFVSKTLAIVVVAIFRGISPSTYYRASLLPSFPHGLEVGMDAVLDRAYVNLLFWGFQTA